MGGGCSRVDCDLARVRSARHSLDLDFVLTDGSIDTAVAELRAAAELDLRDHLTFTLIGAPARREERAGQPGSELVTVTVQSYAGVKKLDQFKVDVVTNSVITQEPDEFVPDLAITLPGMPTPMYRVYPVVDHIADKLCATVELHNGVPPVAHVTSSTSWCSHAPTTSPQRTYAQRSVKKRTTTACPASSGGSARQPGPGAAAGRWADFADLRYSSQTAQRDRPTSARSAEALRSGALHG